jgi:signal transduction histidine kinase
MAKRDDRADDAPPGDDLARLRSQVDRSTHDLANALGAILNYATFLAEDLDRIAAAAGAREYLPHLENATRRALDLVDQLGDAARS